MTNDESQEQLYNHLVENPSIPINSDGEMITEDRKFIKEHNGKYSKLLEIYVKNADETLKTKKLLKIIFFTVCLLIMIATVVIIFIAILRKEDIGGVLASAATFISSVIVIPKIIAQ